MNENSMTITGKNGKRLPSHTYFIKNNLYHADMMLKHKNHKMSLLPNSKKTGKNGK
jgi:hypothetical protein